MDWGHLNDLHIIIIIYLMSFISKPHSEYWGQGFQHMSFGRHSLAHESGYIRLTHLIVLITQIHKSGSLELTTAVEEFITYSFGINCCPWINFSILLDSGLIFQDCHEDVLKVLPHWKSLIPHSFGDLPALIFKEHTDHDGEYIQLKNLLSVLCVYFPISLCVLMKLTTTCTQLHVVSVLPNY